MSTMGYSHKCCCTHQEDPNGQVITPPEPDETPPTVVDLGFGMAKAVLGNDGIPHTLHLMQPADHDESTGYTPAVSYTLGREGIKKLNDWLNLLMLQRNVHGERKDEEVPF